MKFWKHALTQHILGGDIAHFQSAGRSSSHMPVRPLILSPPIRMRALRSDPAHLLVRAGGGGSGVSHCTHFLVWPYEERVLTLVSHSQNKHKIQKWVNYVKYNSYILLALASSVKAIWLRRTSAFSLLLSVLAWRSRKYNCSHLATRCDCLFSVSIYIR